jgi:LysM repeat protein
VKSEPVAARSEPLRLVAPVETGADVFEPRASEPRTEALAVSRPVRAPKLIVPKPEAAPAPVAAKTPKPAATPEALVDAAAPATLASAPVATPVATRAPQVEIVKPARVKPAEVAPPAPAPAPRPSIVVVQAGQTLASIAKQYDNSVASIMMENNLVSEQVKPGQKLKLPPAGRH